MSEATAMETPGIGHNAPPKTLAELMVEATAEATAKADEFEKAAKDKARLPDKIETEDQAQAITKFVAMCAAWGKKVEAERKARKQPYDDQAATVQKAFKPLVDKFAACQKAAQKVLDEYTSRKRKEAEAEAARLQREAAEREAQAAATGNVEAVQEAAVMRAQAEQVQATAGRIHTDTGQSTFQRKNWEVEVVDMRAFVQAVAKGEFPTEWLLVDLAAIRKEAIDGNLGKEPKIPGLRIEQKTTTQVRA
jgi:hypothetical protein